MEKDNSMHFEKDATIQEENRATLTRGTVLIGVHEILQQNDMWVSTYQEPTLERKPPNRQDVEDKVLSRLNAPPNGQGPLPC